MASSYFLLSANIIISLLVANILFPFAISYDASDRAECTESIISISTCLQYVQGNAKTPPPDCCNNLKQVVSGKPKCLCLLIVDEDTPEALVKFNVSLAMSLPSTCHAPTNISNCIGLLKIQPDSKDAKIFEQYVASSDCGNIKSNVNSTENNKGDKSGARSIKLNQLGGTKSWLGGKIIADMWAPLLLSLFIVIVG